MLEWEPYHTLKRNEVSELYRHTIWKRNISSYAADSKLRQLLGYLHPHG